MPMPPAPSGRNKRNAPSRSGAWSVGASSNPTARRAPMRTRSASACCGLSRQKRARPSSPPASSSASARTTSSSSRSPSLGAGWAMTEEYGARAFFSRFGARRLGESSGWPSPNREKNALAPYLREVEQLVRWVLARGGLLVPLAHEQHDGAAARVLGQHRSRRRGEGRAVAVEPRAAFVAELRLRRLDVVFVAQAVLEHIELQLADRRDDRFVGRAVLGPQALHRALGDQLVHALVERFALREVARRDAREDLGLELRQRLVLETAAHRDRVADAVRVAADHADDVAGKRFVERVALLRDHAVRARETHVAVEAMVVHDEIAPETAGTHAEERETVAMAAIHVGLDLEHVRAERRLDRIEHRLGAVGQVDRPRPGRRRERAERIEERLDAEVGQRGTEIGRRDFAAQEGFARERIAGDFEQLEIVARLVDQLAADALDQARIVEGEALELGF